MYIFIHTHSTDTRMYREEEEKNLCWKRCWSCTKRIRRRKNFFWENPFCESMTNPCRTHKHTQRKVKNKATQLHLKTYSVLGMYTQDCSKLLQVVNCPLFFKTHFKIIYFATLLGRQINGCPNHTKTQHRHLVVELWVKRLYQTRVGKELTEEFYQKSFIRHLWSHVKLESE